MSEAAKPEAAQVARATVIPDEASGTVALVVNVNAPTYLSKTGNPTLFNTKGRYVPFGPEYEIQVNVRPNKANAAPTSIGLSYAK